VENCNFLWKVRRFRSCTLVLSERERYDAFTLAVTAAGEGHENLAGARWGMIGASRSEPRAPNRWRRSSGCSRLPDA
jgi:hypothetical protein